MFARKVVMKGAAGDHEYINLKINAILSSCFLLAHKGLFVSDADLWRLVLVMIYFEHVNCSDWLCFCFLESVAKPLYLIN
jgi:hypothetical protein